MKILSLGRRNEGTETKKLGNGYKKILAQIRCDPGIFRIFIRDSLLYILPGGSETRDRRELHREN